ncbi:MAG: PDZ domain-containing protein [Pirellulaceae bacterium]|nr:PDZ domain-containing protein [Pirellulaceae bacterium]
MKALRWYSIVAAAIILLGSGQLRSQDPLQQLEAKLLQQEKLDSSKASERRKSDSSKQAENLPGPTKPSESILVNPPTPLPPGPAPLNGPPDAEVPYLGMTLEKPTGGGMGLRVVEVVSQSPAWKSGFRIDDRILAIGGNAVTDIDTFAEEMASASPNQLVKFLVDRRGRQMDINVVLIPQSVAVKTIPNAASLFKSIPQNPLSATNRNSPRTPQAVDGRGSLGIVLAPLSDAFRRQFGIPVFRGASVLEVAENSPGYIAGLAAGDCIVDIDGKSILSDDDVVRWKQNANTNAMIAISFYRGAQLMQTTLQVPPAGSTDAQGNVNVTQDMLTPAYVQRLQAELSQLREELTRSQSRIESLERQLNR